MKTIGVICSFLAFTALAYAGMEEMMAKMESAAGICIPKSGITDEELMTIMKQHMHPTTRNGFCFLGCMKKEIGMMREDNSIDLDLMIKMGQEFKEEHPEMFEKAVMMMKHCIAHVNPQPGMNECDIVEKLMECCIMKSKELGIQDINMEFTQIRDYSEFCEQLSDMRIKFHKWDSCERTVALYYLMSGLPFANARFLQHVLEHCISNVVTPELQQLERNANDVIFIRSLLSERLHIALNKLLVHLPLLRPGNKDIADSYLTVIRKVLTEFMSPPYKIYNDCVEIMSYLLVHPAFDKEDKKSFKQLLRQMVNRVCPENFNHSPVNEQLSDESISPNPENHLQAENCLRMGRRSNSLTPSQTNSNENLIPQENWSSQENLSAPQKQRSYSLSNDKSLPLNIQITQSSSETRLQDLQSMSNLPVMKGIVFWLKSLRLHKYSWVFTNLTYEQMLNLTDEKLQGMGITKGARHKLLLSIGKLKERSLMMTELETEVMNGGELLAALKKLKTVLQSPLQVTAGEDLPSQFVKVMGKVCTQLLMLRQPSEEALTMFSGLCERAETLEAFNIEQQRRLQLWRTQLSKGTAMPQVAQRNSVQCNNSRQQNVQSQYYLPVSSISYPPQVYNQKSSSYPNVQTNNIIGSHRNSLGNLNHNINLSVPPPKVNISINKDIPTPYNYSQINCNNYGQIRFPQKNENDDRKQSMKNTDIESSLESLCLQMMEHALGP